MQVCLNSELFAACRPRIHGLVAPLESQLDESIGCAIWFAARAKGIRYAPDESVHMAAYTGVAKVWLWRDEADAVSELVGTTTLLGVTSWDGS